MTYMDNVDYPVHFVVRSKSFNTCTLDLLKDLHRIIEILARIPSLQVGLSHKFVYFTFLSIVATLGI